MLTRKPPIFAYLLHIDMWNARLQFVLRSDICSILDFCAQAAGSVGVVKPAYDLVYYAYSAKTLSSRSAYTYVQIYVQSTNTCTCNWMVIRVWGNLHPPNWTQYRTYTLFCLHYHSPPTYMYVTWNLVS